MGPDSSGAPSLLTFLTTGTVNNEADCTRHGSSEGVLAALHALCMDFCRGCCGCGGMQEGEPASGGGTYGNNMLKGPDITSHNCAGYMPRYIPSPQPSTFPQVDNGSRTLPASLSTR